MFDAITPSLAAELRWLGIVPIPNEVLERHKAAECEKHPATWWYRHQIVTRLMLLGCLGGSSMFIGMAMNLRMMGASDHAVIPAILGWMSLVCLVTMLFGVKMLAPARWEERYGIGMTRMPRELKLLVYEARQQIPDSKVVIGILKQHEIVLDPYVVLERGTERMVLGIWDGDQIIAIAERV